MREIKLRAFHKMKKKMYRVCNIDFDKKEVIISGFPKTKEAYTEKFTDVILVEFIGLKDRTGKEIFEGDLFRYYDILFNVAWNYMAGGFYCRPAILKVIKKRLHISDLDTLEIIGNRFENPELLKEESK